MKPKRYPESDVLRRTDFRCALCGRDLLSDVDTFVTFHTFRRPGAASNGRRDRLPICEACFQLGQFNSLPDTLEAAREEVAARRQGMEAWRAWVAGQVRQDCPEVPRPDRKRPTFPVK